MMTIGVYKNYHLQDMRSEEIKHKHKMESHKTDDDVEE